MIDEANRAGSVSLFPDRRSVLLGALAFGLAGASRSSLARAGNPADALDPVSVEYTLKSRGVSAASVRYTAHWQDDILSSKLRIKTTGFFGAFRKVKTKFVGQSKRIDANRLQPLRFDMELEKPDTEREVAIRYAAGGSITSLSVSKDGRERDSKVPADLRADTLDPLTAVAQIRRRLQASASWEGDKTLTYPVFDGRKRYDIEITWLGEIRDTNNPLKTPAQKIIVLQTPIAGYDHDDDDWLRHLRGETRPLELLATADEKAIPYFAISPQSSGEREISLSELCIGKNCIKI